VGASEFLWILEPDTITSGGLQMLFSDKKKHDVIVPCDFKAEKRPNVQFLVDYLCENLLTDPRKELFVVDNSV